MSFANAPASKSCVCNSKNFAVDIHHALSCSKARKLEVNLRHDMVNTTGHKFFRRLNLPSLPEPQNLGGTQQRCDTQVIDQNGNSYHLDWSIVQPTCPSHVKAGSHKGKLHAANIAVAAKHNDHDGWSTRKIHKSLRVLLKPPVHGLQKRTSSSRTSRAPKTNPAQCHAKSSLHLSFLHSQSPFSSATTALSVAYTA